MLQLRRNRLLKLSTRIGDSCPGPKPRELLAAPQFSEALPSHRLPPGPARPRPQLQRTPTGLPRNRRPVKAPEPLAIALLGLFPRLQLPDPLRGHRQLTKSCWGTPEPLLKEFSAPLTPSCGGGTKAQIKHAGVLLPVWLPRPLLRPHLISPPCSQCKETLGQLTGFSGSWRVPEPTGSGSIPPSQPAVFPLLVGGGEAELVVLLPGSAAYVAMADLYTRGRLLGQRPRPPSPWPQTCPPTPAHGATAPALPPAHQLCPRADGQRERPWGAPGCPGWCNGRGARTGTVLLPRPSCCPWRDGAPRTLRSRYGIVFSGTAGMRKRQEAPPRLGHLLGSLHTPVRFPKQSQHVQQRNPHLPPSRFPNT